MISADDTQAHINFMHALHVTSEESQDMGSPFVSAYPSLPPPIPAHTAQQWRLSFSLPTCPCSLLQIELRPV